jgi:threonyl-tRNA synthetase
VDGVANETTPLDIAARIHKKLAERVIVAKVNDKVADLWRPLEDDCKLQLCDFETAEGKHVFWHSSAHILGQALELHYGDAKLCVGPALEDGGFYYDVHLKDKKVVPEDFKPLEKLVKDVTSEKQPFRRLVLTKEEALEMFKFNPFKQEIVKDKVPDGATCTAYRCGPLIDLCKGPHVPNTAKVEAMEVTQNSSSYWKGNAENESLQRVYGISFPDKKKLAEWKKLMEEAKKRDHRNVGPAQGLFFFHDLSPGSAFFLPHGARIYNGLIELMRSEYRKRGFTEVLSPNVFNIDLWKTSGHYDAYREHMFLFEAEKQEFGMKPMNCPGHCLMYKSHLHSYRDLPIRFADFGVLHRNELSGALSGLTRVRRFQQDDAHIFCREDQIEEEISSCLEFLQHVYGIFGFHFDLQLSTRPAKFLGSIAMWDRAEKSLAQCLTNAGLKWGLNEADGAFYGPKIDIQVTDALKRKHQCATIQLDFQLPRRFGLQFKNSTGAFETPVIIHRAILGSVERMMAILLEHTGGKWPFWISPRQAVVIPVSEENLAYAKKVRDVIHEAKVYVDVEDSNKQLNKKIRESQLAQYNYILVVGKDEQSRNAVNVRLRDSPDLKEDISLSVLLERFAQHKLNFT